MDFFTVGAIIKAYEPLLLAVLLFLAFVAYVREWKWKWLIVCAVLVRLTIPTLLSFVQWKVWSAPGHGLTQLFLPPHQPITYFVLYCWTTFFFRQVLALVFAGMIAVAAWALMRYREGAMLQEEAGMLTLSTLVVGWPVALLLPFVTVLTSTLALAIMKIKDKEARMTLGLWSLVSCIGLLVWGEKLMAVLKLQVLFIGR